MNRRMLFRLLSLALVILAIVFISVFRDNPKVQIPAIILCCLLAIAVNSKAGKL